MWSDADRTVLDAILDELIPPGADGRVPGAGQFGVADFFPASAPYAPDQKGAVAPVLAFVQERGDFRSLDRDARVALLKQAEAAHPDAFATLVSLTYMGYYKCPEIRPLFGLGAHPVHPDGYAVAPESEAELSALTGPVRARGPAFRDPKAEGVA